MNAFTDWQPFEPSEKQPWDERLAAHLYRRAGFGANWQELRKAVELGPDGAVDALFEQARQVELPHRFEVLKKQVQYGNSLESLPTYWLYVMANTEAQLLEKTTLFWHGHFATSAEKVAEVGLMLDQNDLLRQHALQPFTPLVQGISKDPAMLIYLDSKVNRKTRPNENYARELMELFCLGLGNYTEQDIKQVARAFTGWEVRNDRFKFNQYQHDYGVKNFLGSTGEFNGEQAVEIVLRQKSSAEFIARKLINYFVTDLPVGDGLVDGLARTLRETEFDIGAGVRQILQSQIFYDAVGQKIRSPVELGIGLLRSLAASGNFIQLADRLKGLGQLPFYPPNVKGWPGGRSWINSATLLGRINLVNELLVDDKTKFEHGSLSGTFEHCGMTSADDALEFLEVLLLARPAPAAAREKILSLLKTSKSDEQRFREALVAIAALPEFQLA